MTRQDQQTSINRAVAKLNLAGQLLGSGIMVEGNTSTMNTSMIAGTTATDPEDQAVLDQVKSEAQTNGNAAILAAIDKGVQTLVGQARAKLADVPELPAAG